MSDRARTEAAPAPAPDAHGARVRGIFSNIARRYALFNALSSFGIYRRWLARVARVAAATPTDRVLDVAGGTGDVAFELCAACPPASITLTDFTPEMLEVARRRSDAGAARGVPVSLMEADAHALPFENASFTLVTCAYGLRNFSDRAQAMREAARVLAPGGRYVVLEFGTPPNPVWRALYRFHLNRMIPLIGGVVTGDASGFRYLRDSIARFPPQDQIAAELRAAGFTEVSYENRTGGIVAIYRAVR
ncbi:MAG: ubiquinone/menaquinone biosynthesis methyltransferase [Coriobacteriaceae bacterium]|nr:ubiquinone/menaquinone biosynthesis methyltransferase [Coriobacteriaceae bacterium]